MSKIYIEASLLAVVVFIGIVMLYRIFEYIGPPDAKSEQLSTDDASKLEGESRDFHIPYPPGKRTSAFPGLGRLISTYAAGVVQVPHVSGTGIPVASIIFSPNCSSEGDDYDGLILRCFSGGNGDQLLSQLKRRGLKCTWLTAYDDLWVLKLNFADAESDETIHIFGDLGSDLSLYAPYFKP